MPLFGYSVTERRKGGIAEVGGGGTVADAFISFRYWTRSIRQKRGGLFVQELPICDSDDESK